MLGKSEIMTNSNSNSEEEKIIHKKIRKTLGGGPHGLGDPDDKHLRKVEKDVVIAKLVRDRTREEKCIPEVQKFGECCKASNVFMVFKCRKENAALKECLTKWYNDQDFWKECTEQFLEERSEYRRTGIPKKVRQFKNRLANNI